MSGFALKGPKASPIALDFGASSLKALQVVPGPTPRLIDAAVIETPAELVGAPLERLAFQFEALPKLLAGAKFIGKRAACSVSAAQTLVQHVQTGADEPDAARAATEAVAGSLGCNASQLVARTREVTTVMRGNQKRTESVCIAIPRAVVSRYMSALRDAKLKPVGIHAEHTALLYAFDGSDAAGVEGRSAKLYLDLGASTTKIAIAHGPDLVLAKTLELSAVGVAPAPKHEHNAVLVDIGESDASTGPSSESAPQPPSAPAELIEELQAAVRYHSVLFPETEIGGLVFVGGCASVVSVCQQIARALRLPAQLADPLSRIERPPGAHLPFDCSKPQPGWALAFGLTACPTEE